MKNFLIGLMVSVIVLFSAFGGALADRLFVIKPLDKIFKRSEVVVEEKVKILSEDGGVVEVVERVSPAVVTVAVIGQTQGRIVFDAFEFFEHDKKRDEWI